MSFTPPPSNLSPLAQRVAQSPALERLVLTGFMGCGKSTIGRRLAQALGFRFVDTDEIVEAQQGKRIAHIFEKEGEAAFRAYEAKALAHALKTKKQVIATGGGALVRQENLDLALDEAVVIYLEVSLEDLVERVLFSPKERPLIDVPNPQQVLTTLFKARQPFYEQAQVQVPTTGLSPTATTQLCLEYLDRYASVFLPTLYGNSQGDMSPC